MGTARSPRQDHAPPVGPRRLGGFSLVRVLGKGSYASVWLAVQPSLGREVAVKVLHPHHTGCPEIAARFAREARLPELLAHPCVPAVYESGVEGDGTPWIAMELVRGESLVRWVTQRGPVPLGAWAHCVVQLAEVLAIAHRAGVVHRDLSPNNVMLTERDGSPTPKLLDLGVARWAAGGPSIRTRAGVAMGTPGFAAPEVSEDAAEADGTADQYALARVSVYALTGHNPAHRHTRDALEGRALPAELVACLIRATQARPGDRFPSVEAFAAGFLGSLGRLERRVDTLVPIPLDEHFSPGTALCDLKSSCVALLRHRSAGDERWASAELTRAGRRGFLGLGTDGTWSADPEGLCAWRLNAPLATQVARRVQRVPGLGADAARLLGGLALAGGELRRERAAALLLPPPRLATALAELEHRSRARPVPGGDTLVAEPDACTPTPWGEVEARALLRAIADEAPPASALPVLRQVWRAALSASDAGLLTSTTLRLARQLLAEEGLVEAALAVETALDRHRGEAGIELLPLAVDLCLAEPTPDRVQHLGARLVGVDHPVAALGAELLRARGRFLVGDVAPTGLFATDLATSPPDALAIPLHRLRVYAALRRSVGAGSDTLQAAEPWFAQRWDDADAHAAFLHLSAFVHSRAGRFHEAAALAFEAAERARRLDLRVDAYSTAAYANIELGKYGPGLDLATRSRDLALAIHSPLRTARATIAMRSATYRAGGALTPDPTLVDAARGLGDRFIGQFGLLEGAIAWRAGRLDEALRYAQSAVRGYRRTGHRAAAVLAGALAYACGARGRRAGLQALVDECASVSAASVSHADVEPIVLIVQALGLLSTVTRHPRVEALLGSLGPVIPSPRRHLCLHVLSLRDALAPPVAPPPCPGAHP